MSTYITHRGPTGLARCVGTTLSYFRRLFSIRGRGIRGFVSGRLNIFRVVCGRTFNGMRRSVVGSCRCAPHSDGRGPSRRGMSSAASSGRRGVGGVDSILGHVAGRHSGCRYRLSSLGSYHCFADGRDGGGCLRVRRLIPHRFDGRFRGSVRVVSGCISLYPRYRELLRLTASHRELSTLACLRGGERRSLTTGNVRVGLGRLGTFCKVRRWEGSRLEKCCCR